MSDHQDVREVRRNLSLAACQPCRKAKTGCDHEKPCSRCVKRGLQDQCIYRTVENPSVKTDGSMGSEDKTTLEQRLKQIERSLQSLQRQLKPGLPSTPSKKRRRDAEEGIFPEELQQTPSTAPASNLITETSGIKLPSFAAQTEDGSLPTSEDDEPFFVGPNSNTQVLGEFISTRKQFKGILDDLPSEHPSIPSALPLWASASDEWRFGQSRWELGERILDSFPPKVLCDQLLHIYFDVFDQIRPIVPWHWANQVLEEIFQIEGSIHLHEITSDSVEIIESHTSKVPVTSPDSPSLANWDNIGTLAAMFVIAAYTAPQLLDEGALHFGLRAEGIQDLVFRMRKVVGMCWELSNHTEYADESTVLLLYFYIFMLITFGEYVPFIEHLFGCLVSAAAVNHLHREVSKNEHNSDYIERRRTEYAAIFYLDKICASYWGRPPSIFRRFSNTLLPSMGTQSNRYLGGQFLIAQAREEVLELILTSPRGPSVEKILTTQKAVLDRYNSITPELKYDSTIGLNTSKPSLNIQRIILYLFSLENSFLLQSVAKKKKLDAFPEPHLLKVSLYMFGAVVRMWEERAEFINFTFVLSWLLTSYAFAAAGVIFSAILQEKSTADGQGDILTVPLSCKSYHLHQLRQFLDALSSIEATDPHFNRCKRALRIFSRVKNLLDETTTPEVPPNPTNFPLLETGGAATGDSSSVDYYSEWGLNQNLGEFGALPWLDHVWTGFGEELVALSEQIDVPPFSMGDVGLEYWNDQPGGT